MNDRPIIVAALLLALGLFTLPVWYNLASGARWQAPERVMPVTAKSCVAPRDYMRTSHMSLLVSWREDVVRRGARDFVAGDGRHYEKNLTATCFGCHQSKKDFCDRCHDYAGVRPNCMDCHTERMGAPGLKPGGPTPVARGVGAAESKPAGSTPLATVLAARVLVAHVGPPAFRPGAPIGATAR